MVILHVPDYVFHVRFSMLEKNHRMKELSQVALTDLFIDFKLHFPRNLRMQSHVEQSPADCRGGSFRTSGKQLKTQFTGILLYENWYENDARSNNCFIAIISGNVQIKFIFV